MNSYAVLPTAHVISFHRRPSIYSSTLVHSTHSPHNVYATSRHFTTRRRRTVRSALLRLSVVSHRLSVCLLRSSFMSKLHYRLFFTILAVFCIRYKSQCREVTELCNFTVAEKRSLATDRLLLAVFKGTLALKEEIYDYEYCKIC